MAFGLVKYYHLGLDIQHEIYILLLCLELFYLGIKFNPDASSDITEAKMLSHKANYTHVYSNSWGPKDSGFFVGGPGILTRQTFETETTEVKIFLRS